MAHVMLFNELKQLHEGKRTGVMETLQTIVQQGSASNSRTHCLVASRFSLARFLLLFIDAALNATNKELKRHLSFNLLEKVMVRRLLNLPI